MKLLHRLKFFLFGVLLGSGIVYMLLIKDRDFPAWLPGDRVIEEMLSYDLTVADSVLLPFADSLLAGHIGQSDVLFKESTVRDQKCRTYQLESSAHRMRVQLCDSVATVVHYMPHNQME